jgi:hypothetical protein
MVTITRLQAKEAFDHVMDKVLGRDENSHLKKSLIEEGIDDVFGLITLTDKTIDNLVYQEVTKSSSQLPVKKGDKMLVKCFIAYCSTSSLWGTKSILSTSLKKSLMTLESAPIIG